MNTGVKITQGLKVYGLNGFNRLNTLNVNLRVKLGLLAVLFSFPKSGLFNMVSVFTQ